jgi:uncharacterized protein
VVTKIFERILEAGIVGNEISIGWHAGEPLCVSRYHYEKIFKVIRELVPANIFIKHNFQTNGILINQEWCDFIKENNVQIGVSIDGPEAIHDALRLTRNGRPTFSLVMKGVELLRKNNINFGVISVLSSSSLNSAPEIYDFLCKLDCTYVSFNIDEVDGSNKSSTLTSMDSTISHFWETMYNHQITSANKLKIRELDKIKRGVFNTSADASQALALNNRIYGILNFDTNGNFSTFSPELLGQKDSRYNDFVLGNVFESSLLEALESPGFKILHKEIMGGIEKCINQCAYYPLCGAGSPSSKLYENGTFNSLQTEFCRYTRILPADVVIKRIEQELNAWQ